MWDTDRPQILHCRAEDTALDVLIALELDFADLYLGTFLSDKGDADSRRGNLPNLGFDRGELTPMFGEQLLDRIFRFLDARGIVLALNDQSNLVLLKTIKNIAVRNRT